MNANTHHIANPFGSIISPENQASGVRREGQPAEGFEALLLNLTGGLPQVASPEAIAVGISNSELAGGVPENVEIDSRLAIIGNQIAKFDQSGEKFTAKASGNPEVLPMDDRALQLKTHLSLDRSTVNDQATKSDQQLSVQGGEQTSEKNIASTNLQNVTKPALIGADLSIQSSLASLDAQSTTIDKLDDPITKDFIKHMNALNASELRISDNGQASEMPTVANKAHVVGPMTMADRFGRGRAVSMSTIQDKALADTSVEVSMSPAVELKEVALQAEVALSDRNVETQPVPLVNSGPKQVKSASGSTKMNTVGQSVATSLQLSTFGGEQWTFEGGQWQSSSDGTLNDFESQDLESQKIATDTSFHSRLGSNQFVTGGERSSVRFVLPQELSSQLQPNGKSIYLRIEPDHLGPVRLNLVLNNGILKARLVVDNPAAKQLVESSLDKLVQQLSESDISVDSIEVSVGGDRTQGNLQDLFPQSQRRIRFMQSSGIDVAGDDSSLLDKVLPPLPTNYVGLDSVNVLA